MRLLAASWVLAGLFVSPVLAATYTWDADGTLANGLQDGAGT